MDDFLVDVLDDCYVKNALPSELGIVWSAKGRPVDLADYRSFPEEGSE